MVDFINEVEEELRKDDYNKLLKRYGPALAVVIFLIIAGTALFEWNKSRTDKVARAASASYLSAADLARTGDADKAIAEFLALSEEAPEGYSGLSLMRIAAIELERGNYTQAVSYYDQAANTFSLPRHRDLAKLKAAYILADNGAYSDVQSRIDSIAAKEAPYEFLARELAGFVAFQAGDMTTARQEFNYLKSIPGVPQTIAERATQFLTLVPPASKSEIVAPDANMGQATSELTNEEPGQNDVTATGDAP